MSIERALATHGWMSDRELAYLAFLAQKSYSIAEIGTWRGRSARAIADNTPGYIWCIDTWQDDAYGAVFPGDAPDLCQHPEWLWNEFNRNLADKIGTVITPLRMTSTSGANEARTRGLTFDLIFIDAGHAYSNVVEDILAWRPLLREGGVLCGHDYIEAHHPDVVKAVNEYVPEFRVIDTIWTTEGA